MTKKIFRAIIATVTSVLLVGLFVAGSFLFDYFSRLQQTQLRELLSLSAGSVENLGTAYFSDTGSSVYRFTLITPDGAVLYDSDADPNDMENHLDREEIRDAIAFGSGSGSRVSSTLMQKTLYEAVRLENGNILRVCVNQKTIGAMLLEMLPVVAAIVLIASAVALILATEMTKTIVKPLETLDLENPERNHSYEEIAPILEKLKRQHMQIRLQMSELKRKSDEFQQITESMNEGLVLLDEHGSVLSINSAAKCFFCADAAAGRAFSDIAHSADMKRAVQKAFDGQHCEFREERNGGEYQILISRTESDGKITGVVILCVDVTQTAFAERNRREFTANVSHELKTPLQSILGSAELLESGLVMPRDTQKFVGNIRTEAARLLCLINDIISLSQLDEAHDAARECVDLAAVVTEVADTLRPAAQKRSLTFTVCAEECTMVGVRRYLYEIVYNLCDNAIRYNREGGSVDVVLGKCEGRIELCVRDTGIGIPPEHQSRIFERFYRVDKSHSKQTGGTGLGLSIVKHAVMFHGGSIRLDSSPGEGTTVRVCF